MIAFDPAVLLRGIFLYLSASVVTVLAWSLLCGVKRRTQRWHLEGESRG